MDLTSPVSALPKVGYHFASALNKLGMFTLEDLIHHYPFRYDDFSSNTTAIESKLGEKVTLKGEIWSIQNIFTKSRKVLTKAVFNDGTSPIELTWFNSPWLTKTLKVGDRLQISGKVDKYKNKLNIIAPKWERLSNNQEPTTEQKLPLRGKNPLLHTGRLVPVYPETFGLTSKWIRTKIAEILPKLVDQIKDPLPESARTQMLDLSQALRSIHFPENYDEVNSARERLSFDELFYIQLATLKMRLQWNDQRPLKPVVVEPKQINEFIDSLPFILTSSQQKVVQEVLSDLESGRPMNRLIQGEVGSGKTVVAAVIIYAMHLNGLKSFLMAPTEILAFQHERSIAKLLEPYGITIGIYTGSRKFTKTSDDAPDVIIGTHALLSDKLQSEDVGLVIIDEQQRFGVEQRSLLRSKAKIPHFLTTTATPIPRTVALTLYGDLDISIIDELPSGRQEITTHVVPNKKREDAYQFISKKVDAGDQVYIITPLIEPSETMQTVKAAKVEFEKLQRRIFTKYKLGLLHGRLSSKEKDSVLNDFKDVKIDILVSTSVVEVGVDIPNATVMVVESADRFGLAQLHQLRGRIGRGNKRSFCFLFSENEDSSTLSRLKNLEKITNGLKLAELDMKIRGSGEIFGSRQSGRFEFKIADFSDLELIEKTRTAAKKILEDNPLLDKYPLLRVKLDNLMANASPD